MYSLWIDDMRPFPSGQNHMHWRWKTTTNQAIDFILKEWDNIYCISFDHDAGDRVDDGGDYIKVLDWLDEYTYENDLVVPFVFHFHSGNSVGVENMRRIVDSKGWKEVK